MITEQQIKELNQKLDVLIRLLAYQLVAETNISTGAPILRRLGLTATEIATVFGTTSNTVNVRLTESKKTKLSKAEKRK